MSTIFGSLPKAQQDELKTAVGGPLNDIFDSVDPKECIKALLTGGIPKVKEYIVPKLAEKNAIFASVASMLFDYLESAIKTALPPSIKTGRAITAEQIFSRMTAEQQQDAQQMYAKLEDGMKGSDLSRILDPILLAGLDFILTNVIPKLSETQPQVAWILAKVLEWMKTVVD